MATAIRAAICVLALATAATGIGMAPAVAQTAARDRIAELLEKTEPAPGGSETAPIQAPGESAETLVDPRESDPAFEQARRLMEAIDAVLEDAAQQRSEAKKLPSKDDFLLKPMWTETREDREDRVRDLLDAALGIATDVPVVEVQTRIEGQRKNIRDLEDTIVALKEKQLTAPKDGLLPGVWTDTVASLADKITETEKRIEENRAGIAKAKAEVSEALKKSGIELSAEQIDLLMDGVLSGDLVRLVATFNAAKLIDGQLGHLMNATGENINAARKYFAMHAALFAMLLHAQDVTIRKIDLVYMPRLDAILKDIAATRAKTNSLLKAENRADQRRALEANRESQKLSEEAAKGYRRYLAQQREQIAAARTRATHDLRIADNTYETVEASFQLRNLMRDSASSFEALQKLEAPTFDQIFQNEALRQEFEALTRKLDAPTS